MSGGGAEKRGHAVAKRCAKLKREGLTHSQISEVTGVKRELLHTRIQLGERLLSIDEVAP